MIAWVIQWAVQQRILVLLLSAVLVVWGGYALQQTPVDAIPDLSDVQVIIKTSYPGQAPQVVQDQVTYPLTTALLSVPGAQTVRGFSFFGDSYVYVIFADDTDMYWARSRVLESLSQVRSRLPAAASPQLGPDATGVGWIYLYALVDRSGQHDLSQLRSVQDWFLKYELQALPGVAEVATVGGQVKQYQVQVDPNKLRAYGIPLPHIRQAIQQANQELGASVIEMAEAEYRLRALGYIDSVADLESIPLGVSEQGVPLLLKDVARIQLGPQMRRGVAELNGEGEVVGGIVVMRFGENAQQTIAGVKARLAQLQSGLPDGVELVTVYDRSRLISRALQHLWQTLGEELLMVALVCGVFLLHMRSALVAVLSLPVGVLVSFIIMSVQGLNANIMSLAGIAIAMGAMIDGAIVMVENLHKHMARTPVTVANRWRLVTQAAQEVGPSLFFSLLIITVSFIPVFTLEAQEGRLFAPLAYTKTYAMAAAAILAVTLVPVLMGYLIRGRVRTEQHNPLNRWLLALYRPVLAWGLRYPKTLLLGALLFTVLGLWPGRYLGSEFMPPLDEGDLMYMPTTYAGISIGQARQLLQQTDKLIASVPEVETVFGKVGRAETATDPAPLTMIETFIQLKPRDQWRVGMTREQLRAEFERLVKLPGVTNAWVMPIKTRIDMLATGIKTPLGIRVAGPELAEIQRLGQQIETLLADMPGTASVYAERVVGGRYITMDIQRQQAARYGLSVAEIQQWLATAVGGATVTQTVEGSERYGVNLRYPQSYRDSPERLALLPVITPSGQQIALGDVVEIAIEDGPPSIKSENARLNGWVLVDIQGVDMGRYVRQAQQRLQQSLVLPVGYSLDWAGQYQHLERAKSRLSLVVPMTLLIIVLLLYVNFRSPVEVVMIMGTLPLALVGGVWLLWSQGFYWSVAVVVGFIALAGVAAETGVIMLHYLKQAVRQWQQSSAAGSSKALTEMLQQAALSRMRPVLMTALATILGLLPVLYGEGTGSEVMSRIAAPMVGGMLTSMLLTLWVLPALYLLWCQWRFLRR